MESKKWSADWKKNRLYFLTTIINFNNNNNTNNNNNNNNNNNITTTTTAVNNKHNNEMVRAWRGVVVEEQSVIDSEGVGEARHGEEKLSSSSSSLLLLLLLLLLLFLLLLFLVGKRNLWFLWSFGFNGMFMRGRSIYDSVHLNSNFHLLSMFIVSAFFPQLPQSGHPPPPLYPPNWQ